MGLLLCKLARFYMDALFAFGSHPLGNRGGSGGFGSTSGLSRILPGKLQEDSFP